MYICIYLYLSIGNINYISSSGGIILVHICIHINNLLSFLLELLISYSYICLLYSYLYIYTSINTINYYDFLNPSSSSFSILILRWFFQVLILSVFKYCYYCCCWLNGDCQMMMMLIYAVVFDVVSCHHLNIVHTIGPTNITIIVAVLMISDNNEFLVY